MTAWTVEALAAKGYGPDGRRMQVPQNARPVTAEKTRADACSGCAAVPVEARQAHPMQAMGDPPAVEEQNATGSYRRAAVALRNPETTGLSGLQSPAKRLSSRAIAKLQPEQRLQIEVVAHWRPRLRPGARLLGINGELPGGGKAMALRAAIRRDMGYLRGTPDLQAVRPGHTLWLEGKVTTDQTDGQAAFADWAHSIGHGYGVFTSLEDAGVLLRIHGMVA